MKTSLRDALDLDPPVYNLDEDPGEDGPVEQLAQAGIGLLVWLAGLAEQCQRVVEACMTSSTWATAWLGQRSTWACSEAMRCCSACMTSMEIEAGWVSRIPPIQDAVLEEGDSQISCLA
jgi:hypothetical protein